MLEYHNENQKVQDEVWICISWLVATKCRRNYMGYQKLIKIDPRHFSDIKVEIIGGLLSPVKLSLKDI